MFAVFVSKASMIAALGPDLAAKYPIDPRGIARNQRHQHGNADQDEDLAGLWRRRLPDGDALRRDLGIHADAKSRSANNVGARKNGR